MIHRRSVTSKEFEELHKCPVCASSKFRRIDYKEDPEARTVSIIRCNDCRIAKNQAITMRIEFSKRIRLSCPIPDLLL